MAGKQSFSAMQGRLRTSMRGDSRHRAKAAGRNRVEADSDQQFAEPAWLHSDE
jgi:hypothetical protein